MKFNLSGKVDGYYHDITVIRNAGKPNEKVEKYCAEMPSKNLILDGFFTRWLSGSLINSGWRFFVGSGTTPPANGNTQLESLIGSVSDVATVNTNSNAFESPDYIASSTAVASWPVGAIVGNISEVGANLRNSTATNALDSRALIVDGVGDPTTISITASDQLIVSYTLRYRIPIEQHVSVVDFGEGDTTCTLETVGALGVGQWDFNVVFDPSFPFRTSTSMRLSNTANLQNDVDGQFNFGTSAAVDVSGSAFGSARRVTLFASPSQFNQVGDIKYMLIMSAGNLARQGILFNPPIAKTNLKSLTLYFDYTLARA